MTNRPPTYPFGGSEAHGSAIDRIEARVHLYTRVLRLWKATGAMASGCNAYERISIELEGWAADGQPILRTVVIDRGNFN